MCFYIYTYLYKYVYICIFIYIYINIYIYMYIHMFINQSIYLSIFLSILYLHIQNQIYIYIYLFIYTHIYIYVCACLYLLISSNICILQPILLQKAASMARGQADFEAADVEGRPVELAFFDAGHLVEPPGGCRSRGDFLEFVAGLYILYGVL